MTEAPLMGLRAIAHRHFGEHVARLRAAGIAPAPHLELHDIDGTFAYCDRDTGDVYLGVASAEGPSGPLQLLLLQSLYDIHDVADLDFLIRSFLPWTPAHELGHHLRVHRRLFSSDAWWEEQIANRLARVLAVPGIAALDRERLLRLLRGAAAATDHMKVGWTPILDLYDEVLPPEDIVDDPAAERWISVDDPRADPSRLARRRALIAEFNRAHTTDEMAYLHLQIGWMYLSLVDPRPLTLEQWACAHLSPSMG